MSCEIISLIGYRRQFEIAAGTFQKPLCPTTDRRIDERLMGSVGHRLYSFVEGKHERSANGVVHLMVAS